MGVQFSLGAQKTAIAVFCRFVGFRVHYLHMFLLVIIYGYILTAILLGYFIIRDMRRPNLFFARHRFLAYTKLGVLALGIFVALYTNLIGPYWLQITRVSLSIIQIQTPIKIAFVSDIQVGKYKKDAWVQKISETIDAEKPDLVVIGGDLISNEGTGLDESIYLEPMRILGGKYPVYYILGNHEYGIGGNVRFNPSRYTGDRSQLVIDRFTDFNFQLLRGSIACPEIHGQQICLYGLDEIWKNFPRFNNWDDAPTSSPLILVSHNPDGTMYVPTNKRRPDLVLAGHTHNGQIALPWIGPLANAYIDLPKNFYYGLNYWRGIPLFTSAGAGESAAPLRLFTRPEIVIVTLTP